MEYVSHFFTNLSKIYDNMDSSYSDLTLHCMEDGAKLKCHRVILSACSEYFTNVFGWSESNVLEVHNGITGDTMERILKFIYSGKISVTLDNVNDILVASNFFDIKSIVSDCVTFILEHLEIDSCVDMLLLSWHLDLSKLSRKIISYIARNFHPIMKDLKKLVSIPVKLMAQILISNDLVIRNEVTNLPTRPAEREKRVLDFILSYTKNLDEYSDDDIEWLLSCVKWQFLDIFEEKEYVLNEFASQLDNGTRVDEVEQCLDVTHTDWFLKSSENSTATYKDKHKYRTRAFSCSELVWLHPLAAGNRTSNNSTHFTIVAKENEHITKMDIIIRQWYNKNVIGGFNIYIASPGEDPVCHHIGISEDDALDVHSIELDDKEHITMVNGSSGHLINELTFETSNSRRFGPFGGGGGTSGDLMNSITSFRESGLLQEGNFFNYNASIALTPHLRIPLDTILVGISGVGVLAQHDYAITQLRFCFRLMVPSSAFLITKEKKCEIDNTAWNGCWI